MSHQQPHTRLEFIYLFYTHSRLGAQVLLLARQAPTKPLEMQILAFLLPQTFFLSPPRWNLQFKPSLAGVFDLTEVCRAQVSS